MIYNIDGEEVEVNLSSPPISSIFNAGYFDGVDYSNHYKDPDLGIVHDNFSQNPHEKGSSEYKIYKAGFIQAVS